jgi:hypothetical protein
MRCVVLVHIRCAGGQEHLVGVRRRMGGDLAFGRQVAGQAPDFLHPGAPVKDEIPIVVLAVGTASDLHLQATV